MTLCFLGRKTDKFPGLMFSLYFVNQLLRETGAIPQPGCNVVVLGPHWWCCLRNIFKPDTSQPCHGERSHAWLRPKNLPAFLVCHGVVNSLLCVCFSLSTTTTHTRCALPSHLVSSCISCHRPLSRQPRSLSHHLLPYFALLPLCWGCFWVADIILPVLLNWFWSSERNLH